jgi:hypothetical protein
VLLAIYGLFGFCVLPFGYFVLLYDPDWFSALFSSLCKEKNKKGIFLLNFTTGQPNVST